MITLTLIILGKLLYNLIHNKPLDLRLGSSNLFTSLASLKVLAKVAKQSLFKCI